MTRKRLATFGERGHLVRLYRDPAREKPFIVVAGVKRKQFSFHARSEAETFMAERRWERAVLTNASLFERFRTEEARGLAPSTMVSYEQAWGRWMAFTARDASPDDVAAEKVYGFPRWLETTLAAATVRTTLGAVRAVFGWAKRLELIEHNRWREYRHKTAASRRTKQRAEYRTEEFERLRDALDPVLERDWRAWVGVNLLYIYGARPNEILKARWSWVDGDSLTIPAEFVKTREPRVLPLNPSSSAVLEVAQEWRASLDAEACVLPGRNGEPYALRDFTRALHAAEDRAGVPHILHRAGHGFRRGLVGDLADTTGDVSLALLAVGDKNLAQAKNYRVRREDTTTAPVDRRAAASVDPEKVRKLAATIRNQPATGENGSPGADAATPTLEGT